MVMMIIFSFSSILFVFFFFLGLIGITEGTLAQNVQNAAEVFHHPIGFVALENQYFIQLVLHVIRAAVNCQRVNNLHCQMIEYCVKRTIWKRLMAEPHPVMVSAHISNNFVSFYAQSQSDSKCMRVCHISSKLFRGHNLKINDFSFINYGDA